MSSTKDDEHFDIYTQLKEKRDKRLPQYSIGLRYMTDNNREEISTNFSIKKN